jgi:hypothetical protein
MIGIVVDHDNTILTLLQLFQFLSRESNAPNADPVITVYNTSCDSLRDALFTWRAKCTPIPSPFLQILGFPEFDNDWTAQVDEAR